MIKLLLVFVSLFITACNANESYIDRNKNIFDTITFDVVQKKLLIQADLPNNLKTLLSEWFAQKVKIDGFDGEMKFIITEYTQEISNISDGKKIDCFLSFKVMLIKSSESKKEIIEGNISSYGTLTGKFSLKGFDIVIQNTQNDLILRLSRDLKSKI